MTWTPPGMSPDLERELLDAEEAFRRTSAALKLAGVNRGAIAAGAAGALVDFLKANIPTELHRSFIDAFFGDLVEP